MRVLLLGSGGREHALAWKLVQSPHLVDLHAAPGNPGIAELGSCHPVAAADGDAVLSLARAIAADLVVVGPEAPLVAGVADHLRHAGVQVFGPGAGAARIEGSKSFAKDVMRAAGVPTARQLERPRAPCVIKADGLAGGKGVVVCSTDEELRSGLEELGGLGQEIVAEELLTGEEVSLFAICDGRSAVVLPVAQDFKRAYDGDEGPNTGGMGSYAPVPHLGDGEVDELFAATILPVLTELGRRGSPFAGTLFAGLMLTGEGPRVLEYNCRFGDPETQSLLALLDGDLLPLLAAAAGGDLEGVPLGTVTGAAVTLVLAAGTYPAAGDVGSEIRGVEAARAAGALVFHAGTALRDGALVTNGGRVLNVTAADADLATARERVYAAAGQVGWEGMRYRSDIAAAAAASAAE